MYLSAHEDDISVRPQPIQKDLHHLDETLIGQNLQSLRKGFLTGKRLVAVNTALRIRVRICKQQIK